MMQLTVLFREQPRTVVVLGAEHLPADPPLIEGRHFAQRWFSSPAAAARLTVATDSGERGRDDDPYPDSPAPSTAELLRRAREVQSALAVDRKKASELFGRSGIQVLIVV